MITNSEDKKDENLWGQLFAGEYKSASFDGSITKSQKSPKSFQFIWMQPTLDTHADTSCRNLSRFRKYQILRYSLNLHTRQQYCIQP